VWVKPESLQLTGSFKIRGAFNALSLLPAAVRPAGVVADSSGNHAQGIAAAAARLGLHATIVMPVDAAPVKVARTAAWGVEIVRSPPAVDERIATAREIAERTGAEYVPPFDDVRIIAGQGTLGLEVAEDLPDVGTVVVPIGGGGLISGTAIALRALRPGCRIVGVEPELAADAAESLRAGHVVRWPAERVGATIADGVRAQSVGELNWAVISRLVDDVVTVPEEAILAAMRFAALEAKLALEPTGALAIAALRTGALTPRGPTVLVATGGNFDPALMAAVLAEDAAAQ